MKLFVLDVSVAAKFVLPPENEPLLAEATRLLDAYENKLVSFIVPDLFWAELGNLLWNAVRRKRITGRAAEDALDYMQARNIPTLPSLPLVQSAQALAIAHDRTVYDCLYVSLASNTGATLITADERLVNSLARHQPVMWLGAI